MNFHIPITFQGQEGVKFGSSYFGRKGKQLKVGGFSNSSRGNYFKEARGEERETGLTTVYPQSADGIARRYRRAGR